MAMAINQNCSDKTCLNAGMAVALWNDGISFSQAGAFVYCVENSKSK